MSDASSSAKIEIGHVVRELFSLLGRNLGQFLPITLLLVTLPTVVQAWLQISSLGAGPGSSAGAMSGILALVIIITTFVLQSVLIHASLRDRSNGKVSIGESLAAVLNVIFPLAGLAILLGLGVGLASILLVVPGLMLATAWAVATPSYLNEPRVGVMGSFGRSAELTRGNRWRIFGLFLLGFVVLIGIAIVCGAIAGLLFSGLGRAGFQAAIRVVSPVSSTVAALFFSPGAAVLYAELRRAKEGVGPEGLAAVFD